MKLIRLGPPGEERPAVLVGSDRALDVSGEVEDYDSGFFGSGGPERLARLVAERGDELPGVDPSATRVGPPIARPPKIIGIGLNYEDHARESGSPIPPEPVVFTKASNSMCGPHDDILLPPGAEKVDWEVELGVVMGGMARRLPDEEAAGRLIAGYCVVHDVSEREFQLERGGQWVKGKSAETFCPTGPWLVTADEIPDPHDLSLRLSVNGEVMQEGHTGRMIFGVRHLVWYLSRFMVLEPGDLICTGTPPGVGMARGRFLREGDRVELSVEGLGTQRAVCRRAG